VKRKTAVINLVDDEEEDAWDALDEIEGRVGVKSDKSKGKEREREQKKPWVPDDMDPVLEELPKWSLLAEVLKEIEEEMMRQESLGDSRPACEYIIFLCIVYDPRLMVRMHGYDSSPWVEYRSDHDVFSEYVDSHIGVLVDHGCGCSARDARTEDDGIEVARVFGVEGETEWAEGRRAGGGWAT
jgi:hypothetical protein